MTRIRSTVSGITVLTLLAVACGVTGNTDAPAPADNPNTQGLGHELFLREWVPGDPRSHGGDGLGPLYNATSCVACHNMGAPGGAGPASKNVDIVTLLGGPVCAEDSKLDEFHPGFRTSSSVLLHRFGTNPEYNFWRLRRTGGVELADMAEQGGTAELEGVRELMGLKPDAKAKKAFSGSGPPPRGASRVKGTVLLSSIAALTQRNPPPLFGTGLIDAIPVEVLREVILHADAEIQGRLNLLKDGRVGRFGWKAQTASLKDFVESACAMELGLEVPTHHQARPPLDFSKKEIGLDLTQDECNALTAFVAGLPAPVERGTVAAGEERPDLAAGRALFARVGCTGCHLPRLGTVDGIYSDLLLHDMGSDLADSGSYLGAIKSPSVDGIRGQEWRTPPLWGFRDSGPYLHDGRAETLEEAVAMHGGQGKASAAKFFELKLRERLQVQTFLNSLVAPPAGPEH
jgi:CxxC motif-containing protein (DUF1111 family)